MEFTLFLVVWVVGEGVVLLLAFWFEGILHSLDTTFSLNLHILQILFPFSAFFLLPLCCSSMNRSPFWCNSVQFSHSAVSNSATPWTAAAGQASLSITNSRSLLRLMSIKSVMPSSHLILFSSFPPAFNQGLGKCISSSHQVAKILGVSASESVLPMNIQDGFL